MAAGALSRAKRFIRKRLKGKGALLIEDRLGASYASLPDLIPFDAEMQKAADAFCARSDVPKPLDTAISKNDLMFLYTLHDQPAPMALETYLETGLGMCRQVVELMEQRFGSADRVESFLDFACGYGRLTRFLVYELDPGRIFVSDIKERAVAFQTSRFGVRGLPSSASADGFRPGRTFDVIYVASLFSHLPKTLFADWLRALYGATASGGMLVVSVDDLSALSERRRIEVRDTPGADDFVYLKTSEDGRFEVVSDAIRDDEAYGITYVSEAHVARVLAELGVGPDSWERRPQSLAGNQDFYLILKP